MRFSALLLAALLSIIPLAAAEKRPILLVLTNHGQMGATDTPTGFFLSEAAHPYEVFEAAGYSVRLASPRGGVAPLDPKSRDLDDPANAAFWKIYGARDGDRDGVKNTLALDQVDPADYSAIFFAGGHGTMWDFADSKDVQSVTSKIYEQGGVVGAVCHGPAALVKVTLSNGKPLVAGRKVAPFTNAEEDAVGLTSTVPFLLQTELEKAGATVMPAADFQENAIRDGRLVTGQNPASARKTAELVIEALEKSNN